MQRQTAINIENKGAQEAADQRLKGRKIEASQRAAAAAGGVDVNTGTAGQLQHETSTFSELDALRITNNAARQAWGYQTQAGLDEWQGKQAETGSYISAASSLLGGASKGYFGYKQMTA